MKKLWLLYFSAAFIIGGMFFVSQIPYLWHAKFFIDGQTIIDTDPSIYLFGGSYKGTAWVFHPVFEFFKYIGVNLSNYSSVFDSSWLILNLAWAMPYLLATWWLVFKVDIDLSAESIFLLLIAFVAYSPYYAAINKEIIPFIVGFFSSYLIVLGRLRAAIAFAFVFFSLYGLFIRSYYLIFIFISILTIPLSRNIKRYIIFYLAIFFGAIVFFEYIPRALIDIGRAEYLEDVSASRIVYFFPDNYGLGFALNRAFAMVRISFPVEIIFISLAYFPFVLFRVYCSFLALRAIFSNSSDGERICGVFIVAFTSVQSLFEPDFGSSFRHLMTLIPFIFVLHSGWVRTGGMRLIYRRIGMPMASSK